MPRSVVPAVDWSLGTACQVPGDTVDTYLPCPSLNLSRIGYNIPGTWTPKSLGLQEPLAENS